MIFRSLVAGLLMATTAGCASRPAASAGAAAPEAAPSTRTLPDVISLAELSEPSLANVDALTIIKRLRPTFLSTRGSASANTPGGDLHVVIDNGPFRTAEALTTIRGEQIAEIRYLNASAAAQRYGSRSLAGPVLVIRRR